MTKQESKEIKKIIKEDAGELSVYFDSKSGKLRIKVLEWIDGHASGIEEKEKKRVLDILAALTKHDKRPKYYREQKRFQGFINCHYIVFE